MVDPNRKINRLTDKDIEFLDECEEEFAFRFTDEDEEFVKYCSQPLPDPPVVPNWGENRPFNRNQHNNGGGGGGGGDFRGNRRWNNDHRRGRFNPYGNNRGGDRRDHNRDHHQRRDNNWNRNR